MLLDAACEHILAIDYLNKKEKFWWMDIFFARMLWGLLVIFYFVKMCYFILFLSMNLTLLKVQLGVAGSVPNERSVEASWLLREERNRLLYGLFGSEEIEESLRMFDTFLFFWWHMGCLLPNFSFLFKDHPINSAKDSKGHHRHLIN